MARIRTIKPEFYTDSKTGSLSGDATKLFIGMLTFSDDYGVIEHDLAALKAKIFPYSVGTPSKIITKPLNEILVSGLVIIFKWAEKTYFWIRNFKKHQKVDKPGKPLIENFEYDKLLNLLNSSNPLESSPCSSSSSVVVVEGSVVEGKELSSPQKSGGGIEEMIHFLNPRKEGTNPRALGINPRAMTGKKAVLLERFEKFWKAYPKKLSKGQAEKTWFKIKPSEQLLATIIAKIEQAKTSVQWIRDHGQFIPYPATWLNAKGWDDEHVPALPEELSPEERGKRAYEERMRKAKERAERLEKEEKDGLPH